MAVLLIYLLSSPLFAQFQCYEVEDVSKKVTYFGGENELIAHIRTNIKYPHYAMSNCISGSVKIKFLVLPGGIIDGVQITQSVGGDVTNPLYEHLC
jgi:hypothetical protein